MNPFYAATPTSLSCLSDRDYQVARAHWMRFGDFSFCRKVGRKWVVEGFGVKAGSMFATKTAAAEYVSAQFCGEARWRRNLEWEAAR